MKHRFGSTICQWRNLDNDASIDSSALTMSTNAMIEASQARADARQNNVLLQEIHKDTRELRAAILRMEKDVSTD